MRGRGLQHPRQIRSRCNFFACAPYARACCLWSMLNWHNDLWLLIKPRWWIIHPPICDTTFLLFPTAAATATVWPAHILIHLLPSARWLPLAHCQPLVSAEAAAIGIITWLKPQDCSRFLSGEWCSILPPDPHTYQHHCHTPHSLHPLSSVLAQYSNFSLLCAADNTWEPRVVTSWDSAGTVWEGGHGLKQADMQFHWLFSASSIVIWSLKMASFLRDGLWFPSLAECRFYCCFFVQCFVFQFLC